ncbi:MAG: hypothetical protein IIT78_01630 [Mycoplasmataceae bacterium]|nr:hypothetical protein [Mycoplasmataceae bacterium]
MKKFIKILTSAFVMTSISSVAVITPIEVTRNNDINSNQIIKSNINNKQIASQNTTNINSILSKVPETKVESMINNSLKNNAIFLQETSNDNKNQVIIQNQKAKNNRKINFQTSYFSYSVPTQTQNTQQISDSVFNNIQNLLKQLSKLKAWAIRMDLDAAAQLGIAVLEEALWPLYGGKKIGYAAAATANADWTVTDIAWTTYDQLIITLNKIFQNWQQLKNDIKSLKSIFNGFTNNLIKLDISLATAYGSNNADEWADTYDVAANETIDIGCTIIDNIISLTKIILFNLGDINICIYP